MFCFVKIFLLIFRPESWGQSTDFLLDVGSTEQKALNLVVLGAHDLPQALQHELSTHNVCPGNEYVMDGKAYTLHFRLIDGDVTLPRNAFKTDEFSPHG